MNSVKKTGWYILYVRSRHEKKIEHQLGEKKIESFLPTIKTTRQWSDRKKLVEVPLFPSYIFVKINSPFNYHWALSIKGVCGVVRFGKEFAIASDTEIDNIKLLLSNKSFEKIEIENQEPITGINYKIQDGPLNGLKCELLKINNKNKIVVKVASLKQNIIATLPKEHLLEVHLPI